MLTTELLHARFVNEFHTQISVENAASQSRFVNIFNFSKIGNRVRFVGVNWL